MNDVPNNKLRGTVDFYVEVLKQVLTTRAISKKTSNLAKQNKGGCFHISSDGHELIGVVAGILFRKPNYFGFPYYRDRGFCVGRGCDLTELIASFLARNVSRHSGGRMMPDHYSHKEMCIPCQSSVVGSQFLQAVGLAKSIKLRQDSGVVYVSAGDGATSQGDFHEALNFSTIHKLPIVFVIQDNGIAISVKRDEQTSGGRIAKMASGYSELNILSVNGCGVVEVEDSLVSSIEYASHGPSLIVADVPRIGPHSNSDDPRSYLNETEINANIARDPIPVLEQWMIDQKFLTKEEIDTLKEAISEEILSASNEAEKISPQEQVSKQSIFKKCDFKKCDFKKCDFKKCDFKKCDFKKRDFINPAKPTAVSEQAPPTMAEGLNQAMCEEMESDSSIIIFGQDVASKKGGVFGITRGIKDKFGASRCFNTPLAESTIVGLAIGLSLTGLHKPVCEIQFSDYMWTGANQLLNEASSYYFRSNGEWNLPIVVRMTYGGYVQGGPYHSQSLETIFAHIPGLKVVIPSNPTDAKILLKSAIQDPNPVVFMEHKALYRRRIPSLDNAEAIDLALIGKARIVREGSDITIISWGLTLNMALDVAATSPHSCEVIDLRSINPLDIDTIMQSVKKTGRVVVVHEAPRTCGFSAEICTRIMEEGFGFLKAPIERVTGMDVPVPYSKAIEDIVLPQKADIVTAINNISSKMDVLV